MLKASVDFDELINDIIDIYSAPIKTKYVHCLGNIKKDVLVAQQIEYHLKSQYPYYYQKVITYCENIGFTNNIDTINYIRFNKVYKFISEFENTESFMDKVHFKLKSNYVVRLQDGECYLKTPLLEIPLTGWGKMMIYLDEFRTGNDVTEKLFFQLHDSFTKEEIQENVFSYLLHMLYGADLIDTNWVGCKY